MMFEGLLLISPGVGMEVDNYIRRVLPGHTKALHAGLTVEHPTTDSHARIRIDLASLHSYHQVSDYVNFCKFVGIRIASYV